RRPPDPARRAPRESVRDRGGDRRESRPPAPDDQAASGRERLGRRPRGRPAAREPRAPRVLEVGRAQGGGRRVSREATAALPLSRPGARSLGARTSGSRAERDRRVLTIERRELVVELGVPALERDRLLEKRFGHDREELGGARRPVGIDVGVDAARSRALESGELAAQDASPRRVEPAPLEQRRAVDDAVLGVELVRELVQHDVVRVVHVPPGGDDVVPREHDRPARPRLAEPCRVELVHDSVRPALDDARDVGVRVDDDRDELRVVRRRRPVEEKDAGVRRDRHADLVRHLEATRALEVLLGEEDLEEAEGLRAVAVVEALPDRDVALDDREPVRREGRLAETPTAPLAQSEHRAEDLRARTYRVKRRPRPRSRSFAGQRNEPAHAVVAEPETAPRHDAEGDGKEQPRVAHAELGRGRSAEVAGDQDGAEDGSPRDDVEDRRHQQAERDPWRELLRVADLRQGLDVRGEADEAEAAVHEEEERDEAAQDAAGPESSAGGRHDPRRYGQPGGAVLYRNDSGRDLRLRRAGVSPIHRRSERVRCAWSKYPAACTVSTIESPCARSCAATRARSIWRYVACVIPVAWTK